MHIVFFSSGDIFYLAIMILLHLKATVGHCLTNIAKLGLFFSYKYYIYLTIELDLFICLGVCYS